MNVYRIENEYGMGFYHNGFYGKFPPVRYWYDVFQNSTDEFIDYALNIIHPRIDGVDWNLLTEHHVHGFTSLTDLKLWFPPMILNKIEENGGVIKKFNVPSTSVVEYHRQCIFDKSKAISEINISV